MKAGLDILSMILLILCQRKRMCSWSVECVIEKIICVSGYHSCRYIHRKKEELKNHSTMQMSKYFRKEFLFAYTNSTKDVPVSQAI